MAGRKRATDSSRNDGIPVTIETFDGSRATGTFSGTLDAAPSHPTDPLYRTINQNLYWGFGTFGAAI